MTENKNQCHLTDEADKHFRYLFRIIRVFLVGIDIPYKWDVLLNRELCVILYYLLKSALSQLNSILLWRRISTSCSVSHSGTITNRESML